MFYKTEEWNSNWSVGRLTLKRQWFRRGSEQWEWVSVWSGSSRLFNARYNGWAFNLTWWRNYVEKRWSELAGIEARTEHWSSNWSVGRLTLRREWFRKGSEHWQVVSVWNGSSRLFD